MMVKAKSKLPVIDKLFRFLNYCAALGILISYLAAFTDPKSIWIVAFFGLAYPPLLLVNVLFIIYWLFRFKKYMLISLVSILVGWSALLNNVGFHKTTPDAFKSRPEQIRMMAYNVHGFTSPQNASKTTRKDILQIIRQQQPDIINMEEFRSVSRGKLAVVDSVRKILQSEHYFFQRFSGSMADGSGLVIFSKFPIVNQGVIRLTDDGTDTKAIYIDVKTSDKTFRIYCVHLQSFLLNAEDHEYMDSVQQKGKTSLSSSRRIGAKLKLGFIRRSDQLKIMKQELAQCPYPYILAGDFNDTPSSYAVNQMAKGIKNAFREKGRGLGRTYNGDIPNYQIDYIMCSNHFDVVNYTVIENKASDHYPIRSDLLLK